MPMQTNPPRREHPGTVNSASDDPREKAQEMTGHAQEKAQEMTGHAQEMAGQAQRVSPQPGRFRAGCASGLISAQLRLRSK